MSLITRLARAFVSVRRNHSRFPLRQTSSSSTSSSSQALPQSENGPNEPDHDQNTSINVQNTTSKFSLRRLDIELEKRFSKFEDRCQQLELVPETLFVRATRDLEDLSSHLPDIKSREILTRYVSLLLGCCGKLMSDLDPKEREAHAGKLWNFIKSNTIPLDVAIYNILIRTMNENGTAFEPSTILEEMDKSGIEPDAITYQRLIHQCCLRGDISGATKLLEKMKELEMPLSENVFASLILGYGKQENPPKIQDLFDIMDNNNIHPTSKSLSAAIISLASQIDRNIDVSEQLNFLLKQLENGDFQFYLDELLDIFMNIKPQIANETLSKILDYLAKDSEDFSQKKRLYRTLFRYGFNDIAKKIFWAKSPRERAKDTNLVGLMYMKYMVEADAPIENCVEECSKLIELGWNQKAFHMLYYVAAEHGNIPLVKICLDKFDDGRRIGLVGIWPLIAQAKSEEELIDVIKTYVKPDLPSADLVETFSDWIWPKIYPNIQKIFELNQELKFKNGILMNSLLQFSIREDKAEEAMKFMLENDYLESVQLDEPIDDDLNDVPFNTNKTFTRPTISGYMINLIAKETKDPSAVQKAFDMCRVPGKPINPNEAKPLIKVHLENGDFNSALETFFKLAEQHKVIVYKSALIKHCLVNKDPTNLEKIIDCVSDIHGRDSALYELALCCIQCDKPKQAKKIMTSSRLRIRPIRFYNTCKDMASRKDIDQLEKLVELSPCVQGLDQEIVYEILIRAYGDQKLGKRALNFYNKMQEDEFQPSKRILSALAKVLKDNGLKVPFVQPDLKRSSNQS